MADRDILFKIGVTGHPETGRRLAELAESVKRTMLSVEGSITSVGTKAADTSRLISAAGVPATGGVAAAGQSGGAAHGNRISGSAGGGVGGGRLESQAETYTKGL